MKRKLLLLLVTLLCASQYMRAQEAYVVYNDGTLTFYYDNEKSNREGSVENVYASGTYNLPRNAGAATRMAFDESFAAYKGFTSLSGLFRISTVESIEGLKNLNTENVTDMSNMFDGCRNLTSLDLSSFNTENVTDMSNMFYGCSNLTSLDLSSFNTGNVTNMRSMFEGCSELTSLDLSNFNTKNVTDMSIMFSGCSNLASLDLSSFNTENVTNMERMFSGCPFLTALDLSNFNTQNVINMGGMFSGCSHMTSLDLSNINTQNVIKMRSMFSRCGRLTSLDLSSFNTENVTDMRNMFSGCDRLTSLDLSSFDTKNVTDMNSMFYACYCLTSLDLSSFDTGNVTDISYMFYDCGSLDYLDISNFSRKSLTDASYMLTGVDESAEIKYPDGWSVADISVRRANAIVGDFIYTLYEDKHADMKGIVNSLSGDVVIPATCEYDGVTYNVKNVNSVTDLYYRDGENEKYSYVSAKSSVSDDIGVTQDYTQVTSITFENGIEYVNDGYLYKYYYSKVVNIPKSVTYISPETYYMRYVDGSGYMDEVRGQGILYDAGLIIFNDITFNVDKENTAYASLDGALYDKDMKTLLRCPKGKEGVFKVPDGVEKIDRYAFMHCLLLTEILLPSSVRVLGDDGGDSDSGRARLFANCYSLEKVNIPEGVERIESHSFRHCLSLKELVLPNSLKYYNTSALTDNTNMEKLDWQECELDTLDMIYCNDNSSYYTSKLLDGSSSCVASLPESVKNVKCGYYYYYPNSDYNEYVPLSGCLFSSNAQIPETLTLPSTIENFDAGIKMFDSSTENTQNLKNLYVLMDKCLDIDDDFFGYKSVRVGRTTVSQFPQDWANQCTLYVPANLVEAYKSHAVWSKFSNIVGVEVIREIEPIEKETVITFEKSDYVNEDETPVDLSNTVINDTYFSIDNTSGAENPDGFYSADEQCIVINKATSNDAMTTVVASELGSNDFTSNFTGMVVEVNGAGSIKVSTQTAGNNRLAVKVGNAEAETFAQTTKGDVTVNYDVTENTYVYIYAVDADNQQQSLSFGTTAVASDNAVKVYSVTVLPEATAIDNVALTVPVAVIGSVYSLDGKKLSQPQKGVNIIKMSDGTTKKVVR